MILFFHIIFELKLFVIFIFVFQNCQSSFSRSPLRFILVCKIPEFWRWKLWDQNFVPFNLGNIHMKKISETGFTFSIELRPNLSYLMVWNVIFVFSNFLIIGLCSSSAKSWYNSFLTPLPEVFQWKNL